MDVKSLMIGDWVCYDGDVEYTYPVKVDGLTTDDISLDGEGFLGGIDGMVMPIPLTAEMLEKNACAYSDGVYDFVGFYVVKFPEIYAIVSHYDDEHFLCNIFYIHELQHALRLCGLKDLADNFKV